MMMSNARPYYGPRLEALVYRKAKDLICYHYDAESEMPPAVTHLVGKATRAKRMRARPLDFARYEADLAIIMDIFNDAWPDNWGFVPMSQAELRHLAKARQPVLRPQSVALAAPHRPHDSLAPGPPTTTNDTA